MPDFDRLRQARGTQDAASGVRQCLRAFHPEGTCGISGGPISEGYPSEPPLMSFFVEYCWFQGRWSPPFVVVSTIMKGPASQ